MSPRRPAFLVTICAISALSLISSSASGHLPPFDLFLWGPFGAGTLMCDRSLGRAAESCFHQVLAVERKCLDAQLSGTPCDPAARDARINAVRQASQDVVDAACFGGQLTELHFNSFDEAKSDVSTRACTEQTDATMSVVYGPALAAPSLDAVDAQTRQCLVQTAAASQMFLRAATRLKRRAFDRMGVRYYGPSIKKAMMARAAARIAAIQQALARRLAHTCPAFAEIYGRDPQSFLAVLESRADCVVGAVYVQTEVTCPSLLCGNGIKEPGEQCDDGNTVNDDHCHNDCTNNP